ncbi:hypothetical protein NDN08_002645 [Rhodosorus marinus]|uniref:Uncharacterized protein n=1 Tax=Rhodosorus marinus TaxID=101924 RepID=A0AAV8UUA8_9RHOD|nr:hypothetical protein NDN08_002645 [Rhodosorus marinus]
MNRVQDPVRILRTAHLYLITTITPLWATASLLTPCLSRVKGGVRWRREHSSEQMQPRHVRIEERMKHLTVDDSIDKRSYIAGEDLAEVNGIKRTTLTLLHNPRNLMEHPEIFPDRYCTVTNSLIEALLKRQNITVKIKKESYLDSFEPKYRRQVEEFILSHLETTRVEVESEA